MAAPKRTVIQTGRDRREIADLYLQGWTQQRIADRLNESGDKDDAPIRGYTLSQRMISYDLKKLQEAWRASALIDIDEAKARALAKVDRLEREYWTAWERSRKDSVIITQAGKKPAEGEMSAPDRVTRITKPQEGNPRFLAGVQWCIERRCKIIGVDEPTRVDALLGSIDLSQLTDAQINRLAEGESLIRVLANQGESRA